MSTLKDVLPPKIYNVIERAGISTVKEIVTLSKWDIKKLTNLRSSDIELLKNVAANEICPQNVTCDMLDRQEIQSTRVSTGCEAIDSILRGGFRRGTLTEVYGESGTGKTQISLQAAVNNWKEGCVYICTDNVFPVKRFEQIKQSIPNYNPNTEYGKNIFIEHITEASDVLSCIRVRLPILLEKNNLRSLIVIDSVASPFRSEYTNYIQRAEDLRELAMLLINLALRYNLAVLCINQVSANFDVENILPSLGLTWANMVSTRLWLKKTPKTEQNIQVREISVIFSPDVPNSSAQFCITPTGIQSVNILSQ